MGSGKQDDDESTRTSDALGAESAPEAASSDVTACAGMRVVELGSRLAVGACGRQLADLGAQVFVIEPRIARTDGKWADRAVATAGKLSVSVEPADPADVEMLVALVAGADVVLLSEDIQPADALPAALAGALERCPIVCSITAFGSTGPLSKGPVPSAPASRPKRDAKDDHAVENTDETKLQAMSGLMATTGFADGVPVAIGVPFIELSSGLYAATAVMLAWRVLLRDGAGQHVEVALYDAAVNALTTFLPGHFAGEPTRRLGNGHGMAVPWNAYRTADGWILICLANDPQWQRLAPLIDPALASDPRFIVLGERVARRTEIDAILGAWTITQERDALVTLLGKAGIACGAIIPVAQLGDEPNLAHRGLVAEVRDPLTGTARRVPGPVIGFADEPARQARRASEESPARRAGPAIPWPDSGRELAVAPRHQASRAAGIARSGAAAQAPSLPFVGLRVLEIGQFTTAPLTARYLANFGADVIKLEPEEGETARIWSPMRNGTSHFFVMSNGTKRCIGIDLRSAAGQARFARLLERADVLVENLKAGSLERLGFGSARLRALNPRLVYCAISGFGTRSVYPGRPAFDTVVQAMSGMMDSTRGNGIPLKSGISSADIGGGQMGLLAIIAALQQREHSGRGSVIDLSMQDVGAWFTHPLWNRATNDSATSAPAASSVATGARAPAQTHANEPSPDSIADLAAVAAAPQTAARELIVWRRDADGMKWELLGSPMRLSLTPAIYGVPIGRLGHGEIDWLATGLD